MRLKQEGDLRVHLKRGGKGEKKQEIERVSLKLVPTRSATKRSSIKWQKSGTGEVGRRGRKRFWRTLLK